MFKSKSDYAKSDYVADVSGVALRSRLVPEGDAKTNSVSSSVLRPPFLLAREGAIS